MKSLMKSEREIYNSQTDDVSNGFRDRRIYHSGQIWDSCPSQSWERLLSRFIMILKDQEAEVKRLICSLYAQGMITKQVGDISEEFYGNHYSKSQLNWLFDTARGDISWYIRWYKRKRS